MHLTRRQIAELRSEFTKGGLEASLLAAQLLEIVEKMQAQLQLSETLTGHARREFAQEEAVALSAQLADAAAHGADCPSCHNAEARAFVARLMRIAQGLDVARPDPSPSAKVAGVARGSGADGALARSSGR